MRRSQPMVTHSYVTSSPPVYAVVLDHAATPPQFTPVGTPVGALLVDVELGGDPAQALTYVVQHQKVFIRPVVSPGTKI